MQIFSGLFFFSFLLQLLPADSAVDIVKVMLCTCSTTMLKMLVVSQRWWCNNRDTFNLACHGQVPSDYHKQTRSCTHAQATHVLRIVASLSAADQAHLISMMQVKQTAHARSVCVCVWVCVCLCLFCVYSLVQWIGSLTSLDVSYIHLWRQKTNFIAPGCMCVCETTRSHH